MLRNEEGVSQGSGRSIILVKRRIDPSKSPGRLDDIKRKPVPNADSKDGRGDKDQISSGQ